MRKNGRNAWRRFAKGYMNKDLANKGLWHLSKWARERAGKPPVDPHLPALRRDRNAPLAYDNNAKAELLAEKFFPPPAEVDLSDLEGAEVPEPVDMPHLGEYSVKQVRLDCKGAPIDKALKPDYIPNKAL